jgi:hypothetical protein
LPELEFGRSPQAAKPCGDIPLRAGAQCKDEDGVDIDDMAVERNMGVRSPADEKFPLGAFDRSDDQRTVSQDVYRLHDLAQPLWDVSSVEAIQVVDEAIEVIEHFGGEFDSRHPSFRAGGFMGFSPRPRAAR